MSILQKQVLFLLLFFFSVSNLYARKSSPVIANDSTEIQDFSTSTCSITDSVVNYGKLFLNAPYRHGSSNGIAFDCSGFTSFIYQKFGYNLDHSSGGQAEQVNSLDICELKKGDLVFYSGRRRSKSHVGHVGIVTETDENGRFRFIHASSQHGIIISNSEEPYYLNRFIKAGRVVFDNKLLAVEPRSEKIEEIKFEDEALTPIRSKIANEALSGKIVSNEGIIKLHPTDAKEESPPHAQDYSFRNTLGSPIADVYN